MRALEQHNSTVEGQGHPVRPDGDHSPCDQEWPLQGLSSRHHPRPPRPPGPSCSVPLGIKTNSS